MDLTEYLQVECRIHRNNAFDPLNAWLIFCSYRGYKLDWLVLQSLEMENSADEEDVTEARANSSAAPTSLGTKLRSLTFDDNSPQIVPMSDTTAQSERSKSQYSSKSLMLNQQAQAAELP